MENSGEAIDPALLRHISKLAGRQPRGQGLFIEIAPAQMAPSGPVEVVRGKSVSPRDVLFALRMYHACL